MRGLGDQEVFWGQRRRTPTHSADSSREQTAPPRLLPGWTLWVLMLGSGRGALCWAARFWWGHEASVSTVVTAVHPFLPPGPEPIAKAHPVGWSGFEGETEMRAVCTPNLSLPSLACSPARMGFRSLGRVCWSNYAGLVKRPRCLQMPARPRGVRSISMTGRRAGAGPRAGPASWPIPAALRAFIKEEGGTCVPGPVKDAVALIIFVISVPFCNHSAGAPLKQEDTISNGTCNPL